MTTIYQRLNTVRVELQQLNLKKSGKNTFAGFEYYELCDFVPAINSLCHKHKLTTIFQSTKEIATLLIVDSEKPEVSIKFDMPFELPAIKGANALQNLGGAVTYLRRYLFITAFEIVENDMNDATIGKDEPKKEAVKPDTKASDKVKGNKEANEIKAIKNKIATESKLRIEKIGKDQFVGALGLEGYSGDDIRDSQDINLLKKILTTVQSIGV